MALKRILNTKLVKWFFHRYFAIPKDKEIVKITNNSIHYFEDKSKGIIKCRLYQSPIASIPFIKNIKRLGLAILGLVAKNPLLIFFGLTDTTATNNKDGRISSVAPNTNYGSNTNLPVANDITNGNYFRSLIHFTLPSGSGSISAVKLYLYKYIDVSGYTCPAVEVHELTRTNWTEAGFTWNTYDGTNNWTTAGGDFSATIVDTTNSPLAYGNYGWEDWDLGTGATNPISGLTWGSEVHLLLKHAAGAALYYTQWYSKEYTDDTAKRPYIEITYSATTTSTTSSTSSSTTSTSSSTTSSTSSSTTSTSSSTTSSTSSSTSTTSTSSSTTTSSSTSTTSTSSSTTTSSSTSSSTTSTSSSTTTSSSTSTTSTSSSTTSSTSTTSTSSSTTTSSSTSSSTTSTSSSTTTSSSTSTTSTSSSTTSSTSTTSTSSSTSSSTTSTSSSTTSTSSSSSTTTTLPLVGGLAFGEQSPTQGEIATSWKTWDDGSAGPISVVGDADWGKMALSVGTEGRSRVYSFTASALRITTITNNKYGTGQGTATTQYRVSDTLFTQDDNVLGWTNYTVQFSATFKYIQVRVIKT